MSIRILIGKLLGARSSTSTNKLMSVLSLSLPFSVRPQQPHHVCGHNDYKCDCEAE